MTGEYTAQRMRCEMKKNWPQAMTPVHDLVITAARMRDLLFERDRPIFSRHELTPAQFDVLVTLRKMPPPHRMTPTALRSAMLITSGGLTRVLQQLEEKGLVVRQVDARDRRINRVQLTRRGKRTAELVLQEVLECNEQFLDGVVSKSELRATVCQARKLLDALEAATR